MLPDSLSSSGACGDPGSTQNQSDMSVVDTTPAARIRPHRCLVARPMPRRHSVRSRSTGTQPATIPLPLGALSYQVFQATAPMGQNFGISTATTAGGVTTHTVTGLTANTKYYFVVRAVDASGNVDKNTTEVSATTPVPTPKPTFGGVTGAMVLGNPRTPTWAAASDNALAAGRLCSRVYQATTAGGQVYANPSYTTNPGVTSYQAASGLPTPTISSWVRAVDESGNATTNTQERSGLRSRRPLRPTCSPC